MCQIPTLLLLEVMGVDFPDKNEDKVNEFTHKLWPQGKKVSCSSEWSGSYQ